MRLAAALALLFAATVQAQAATLPPRDECLRLDGYFAFRQELESVVKARDAVRLLALTSDSVEWSFGADAGKAGFAKAWKLDSADAAKSPIWAELDPILPLGCGVEAGGGFALPYLYTAAPDAPNGADPFTAAVVTGNGVNLRRQSVPDAPVLAKLSWEVVERLTENEPAGWDQVRTATGQTGFIRTEFLRAATDYRAGFARREGRWQLVYFVAGD